MSTGPRSMHWFGLAAPMAAQLVPLWLVLTGTLDVAAVVLCYVIEAAIIGLFASWPADDWVQLLGVLFFVYVILLGIGVYAAIETDWSLPLGLGVAISVAALLGGLFWSGRELGGRTWERAGGFPRWLRSFAIPVAGCLGMAGASMYDRLLDHGWVPAQLGTGWDHRVGDWTLAQVVALDIAPTTLAAAVLVIFQLFNELLYETYVFLRRRVHQQRLEYADTYGLHKYSWLRGSDSRPRGRHEPRTR